MASFKILNNVSPPFRTKKGVKQGRVASPLLFYIVMNRVITDILGAANLLELGSNQPWFLENRAISYADDLVLIAKNLEEANNLVLILNTFSLKVGLDINFDKAVIMPHAPPLGDWLVGGKVIKVVSSYKYLGVNIDNKGSYKDELRFRIQNSRAAFYKYFKLWRTREISVFTRLRIFNSSIIPILLYGGDTWEITKTETKRLQTFVNKCLRIINGVFNPNIISNDNLWRRSKHTPVQVTLKKKRITFFAHILRNHTNKSLVLDAINWLYSFNGKSYGRFKRLWYYRAMKDIMDMNLNTKQFLRLNKNKRSIKKLLKIKSNYLNLP
ncbi:uncharacterized protein LOC135928280 [Gordionus sp. m RMFG-2023]|uniref:uncharacterized protein LOC135928280 n=1 Tax=Gordionus sp. m RMFG-2023 TaxID=3053472 RepID=UPI0031FD23D7